MDEYSQSGPRSPRTESLRLQRDMLRRMQRLLEIRVEEEFVETLRGELGISADHPNFRGILKVWRERHL